MDLKDSQFQLEGFEEEDQGHLKAMEEEQEEKMQRNIDQQIMALQKDEQLKEWENQLDLIGHQPPDTKDLSKSSTNKPSPYNYDLG